MPSSCYLHLLHALRVRFSFSIYYHVLVSQLKLVLQNVRTRYTRLRNFDQGLYIYTVYQFVKDCSAMYYHFRHLPGPCQSNDKPNILLFTLFIYGTVYIPSDEYKRPASQRRLPDWCVLTNAEWPRLLRGPLLMSSAAIDNEAKTTNLQEIQSGTTQIY